MSENTYYILLSHVSEGKLTPEDCKEIKALERELDTKKQKEIEISWGALKNAMSFYSWLVDDPTICEY